MRYKCVTCGIEFDSIEQLAAHKQRHQQTNPNKTPSMTCLGCGKNIPLEPSKTNYSGSLECPHCHRILKVVIEGGEVCVARLG